MTGTIILIVALAILCSIACGVIAKRNGKDPWSWALAGFVLNLLALIIILLVKNIEKTKLKPAKGG